MTGSPYEEKVTPATLECNLTTALSGRATASEMARRKADRGPTGPGPLERLVSLAGVRGMPRIQQRHGDEEWEDDLP